MEKDEKDPSVRYVYGKVTDGSVDNDDQIVDPAFARKALAEWYETGANVRQMHSTNLPPAGKGVLLESKGSDGEYVRTKVIEPVAVRLVDEGVYSGYSVGISRPRIDRDVKARNGRIVAGKIVEISLVDRPALPTAKFAVLKLAGGGLTFIGKSEKVPERYAPAYTPIKKFQLGAHVTVQSRDTQGIVQSYEGVVKRRGVNAVELDTTGFEAIGRRVRLADMDTVAAYKGSGPALTKLAAAGRSSTEVSVAVDIKKGAFPGAAAPFGAKPDEDKAEMLGHTAAGCDGSFGDDGKCSKCGGMKSATKGAPDLSGVLEDINDIKEDVKDTENDLEDITGQKADGDDKDDEKGEDKDGKGDDSDDSDDSSDDGDGSSPADKVSKRARVEQVDGAFNVVKGSEVLGRHPSREAAEAQLATYKRSRKAAKIAAKAAKKAAKVTKAERTDEVPWLLKRAHDFTCAAYDTESVTDFYPAIEKSGVGAALGPDTRNAIYAELASSVGADGGRGEGATSIAYLGKSLASLQDFLTAEENGGAAAGALAISARNDLHEAFKAENPILGTGADTNIGIPKPSESGITPGQFKRPYITTGHQREGGSGNAKAHIPETTHPLSADDFKRGPLTDGHQRYLTGKLADIHDGLAGWKPEICRMSAMDDAGSFASQRQPANPAVAGLPNRDSNGPAGASFAGAPALKALTEEDIAAIVTKATTPLLEKITSLQSDVDKLGAQPDPDAAAVRGIAGADVRKVEKISAANEVQQEAERSRKGQRIDYLRSIAANGTPEQRIQAQERLAALGVE